MIRRFQPVYDSMILLLPVFIFAPEITLCPPRILGLLQYVSQNSFPACILYGKY